MHDTFHLEFYVRCTDFTFIAMKYLSILLVFKPSNFPLHVFETIPKLHFISFVMISRVVLPFGKILGLNLHNPIDFILSYLDLTWPMQLF